MEQTKLYVLTGFLGAGKTTVLKALLEALEGHRAGVIQNEFGKLDVDGEILAKEGLVMEEITRGSIFCSCLQLNFARALADMAQKELEYLFVESSGLGDPSNLQEILDGVKLLAGDKLRLQGTICLVDGLHFEEQLGDLEAVERQLKHCNLAILSKVDLLEPGQLAQVESRIRAINPICPILHSSLGQLPAQQVLADLCGNQWAQSEATTNTVEQKQKTLSLSCDVPVEKGQLEAFLQQVLPDAYRIKGFFQLAEGWFQVDVVGQRIDYKPCPQRGQSQLVFISRIGPQIIKNIAQAWESCLAVPMKLHN